MFSVPKYQESGVSLLDAKLYQYIRMVMGKVDMSEWSV